MLYKQLIDIVIKKIMKILLKQKSLWNGQSMKYME